jgi:hypothetical protein
MPEIKVNEAVADVIETKPVIEEAKRTETVSESQPKPEKKATTGTGQKGRPRKKKEE